VFFSFYSSSAFGVEGLLKAHLKLSKSLN
jgi:hypothetical protein